MRRSHEILEVWIRWSFNGSLWSPTTLIFDNRSAYCCAFYTSFPIGWVSRYRLHVLPDIDRRCNSLNGSRQFDEHCILQRMRRMAVTSVYLRFRRIWPASEDRSHETVVHLQPTWVPYVSFRQPMELGCSILNRYSQVLVTSQLFRKCFWKKLITWILSGETTNFVPQRMRWWDSKPAVLLVGYLFGGKANLLHPVFVYCVFSVERDRHAWYALVS